MTGSNPVSFLTEIGQLTRLESMDLGMLDGSVPTELGLLLQLWHLFFFVQSATGKFRTGIVQLLLLESFAFGYWEIGTPLKVV